jgi:hypothetical protein
MADQLARRLPRRLGRTLLLGITLLVFAACGSVGKLSENSSRGASLAGTWKLNRSASDDLRAVMEKMHRRAPRPPREVQPDDDLDAADLPTDGRQRDSANENGRGDGGGRNMRRGGGMPFEELLGTLGAGRNVLRIEQRSTEIVLDNGVRVRKFTPGDRSVVSEANGVADQRAGWKGPEFVIQTSGRGRPTIVERYALSPDGRQLLVNVKLSGNGGMPNIELKRVYDSAPASAANQEPST